MEEIDNNPEVCRPSWRNCAVATDSEILAIDRLEDAISPLAPGISRTRELISTLELCHHKAERWLANIVSAIASGDTAKGLGTRPRGVTHSLEGTWKSACAALSGWCAGCPVGSVDLSIGDTPASELLGGLGPRSPLKEWQVHRIIERTRGHIGWPGSLHEAAGGYLPLLEAGREYESMQRTDCPEQYREHADFWQQTVQTPILDTELGDYHSVYGALGYGEGTVLSLATAIDMLWPCHWDYVKNLETVLGVIGGDPTPRRPFAFCARNIKLSPIRERMKTVSRTLRVFCEDRLPDDDVEAELLASLGEPSRERQWLASSLDKTIRLQMDL
ncbi:hypothetical protein ACFL5A_01915 [Gemmatimonadota bacterium]